MKTILKNIVFLKFKTSFKKILFPKLKFWQASQKNTTLSPKPWWVSGNRYITVPFYWNLTLRPARALAWVDASDFAVASVPVVLWQDTSMVPVTTDNWLLTASGAYRHVSNCAQLQVDLSAVMPKTVSTRDPFDLDSKSVHSSFVVHRNLQYYERVLDSNERELLAAQLLLTNCGHLLGNMKVVLYFDNTTASVVTAKGSNKPHLQKYATEFSEICHWYPIRLCPVWIPQDLQYCGYVFENAWFSWLPSHPGIFCYSLRQFWDCASGRLFC